MTPFEEITVIGRGGATRCSFERALHFADVARQRGRVVMFASRNELGTLCELAWVGAVGRIRPEDIEAVVLVTGEPDLFGTLRRTLGSAQRAPLNRSFNMLFALLGDQLASGPLGLSIAGPPVGLSPDLSPGPADTSFRALIDAPQENVDSTLASQPPRTLPPQPGRSLEAYGRAKTPPLFRKKGTPA